MKDLLSVEEFKQRLRQEKGIELTTQTIRNAIMEGRIVDVQKVGRFYAIPYSKNKNFKSKRKPYKK